MSEIFHQFLAGGWKANSAFEYGKFLSMLKNHDAVLRSATCHQSVIGGF